MSHIDIIGTKITIDVSEFDIPCDGCGTIITGGNPHITEIESCCGQCCRSLCFGCVLAAAEAIKDLMSSRTPDKSLKDLSDLS